MRVLGVDPGSIRNGWGVIDSEGPRLRFVSGGVIKAAERLPLEKRLAIVFEGLTEIVAIHRPDVMAVEEIFHGKYAQAALRLGHVRGVALVVAARADLVVHPYPPAIVKRAVAGRGAAEKGQVARIVAALLGLAELPEVDATDALAVAIAHARTVPMLRTRLGRR